MKYTLSLAWFMIGGLVVMCFIIALKCDVTFDDYESRIQALEQSQCAVKQESAHNQVKFDRCMDQLKR